MDPNKVVDSGALKKLKKKDKNKLSQEIQKLQYLLSSVLLLWVTLAVKGLSSLESRLE